MKTAYLLAKLSTDCNGPYVVAVDIRSEMGHQITGGITPSYEWVTVLDCSALTFGEAHDSILNTIARFSDRLGWTIRYLNEFDQRKVSDKQLEMAAERAESVQTGESA